MGRWPLLGVALLLLISGCTGLPGSTEGPCAGLDTAGDTYEAATVRIFSPEGQLRGTVDARVADSERERCIGLSETTDLREDEGMWFVFDSTAERTFVMRGMDFALDIVYVAGNGTITTIHQAPTEEPPLTAYEGRARWVLEVHRGWTTAHNVSVGDEVTVTYSDR
jgi:uncharacterized membrane protein (UPF0127 family)